MDSGIGIAVFVVGVFVVDALFAWMHRRGWIYWEGPSLLALNLLASGYGRVVDAGAEREREVVLVPVGNLPPERYPERLSFWKREHPRLRVTGVDRALQYRGGSAHLAFVVIEEAEPVAQSFAWHPVGAVSGEPQGMLVCTTARGGR